MSLQSFHVYCFPFCLLSPHFFTCSLCYISCTYSPVNQNEKQKSENFYNSGRLADDITFIFTAHSNGKISASDVTLYGLNIIIPLMTSEVLKVVSNGNGVHLWRLFTGSLPFLPSLFSLSLLCVCSPLSSPLLSSPLS